MNTSLLFNLAGYFGMLSLISFGGVSASLPEMHRYFVDQNGWMDSEQFTRLFGIANAAPGPNMMVVGLLGFQMAGAAGAVASFLAMALPSSLFAYYVGGVWHRFRDRPWRIAIQSGLLPLTVGLLLASGYVLTLAADGTFAGPRSRVSGVTVVVMLLHSASTRCGAWRWARCWARWDGYEGPCAPRWRCCVGRLLRFGRARRKASPQRPVSLIVPFAAGGGTDSIARDLARKQLQGPTWVSRWWWTTAAALAARSASTYAVAQAPADGYTLLFVTSTFVTRAATEPQNSRDILKEFAPVAMIGRGPLLVVANKETGINTLAEMIARARAKPDSLNFCSAGIGSINHLAGELFGQRAGIRMTHACTRAVRRRRWI